MASPRRPRSTPTAVTPELVLDDLPLDTLLESTAGRASSAALRAATTRAITGPLQDVALWPPSGFADAWWPGDAAALDLVFAPGAQATDTAPRVLRLMTEPLGPCTAVVGTLTPSGDLVAPPAALRGALRAAGYEPHGRREPWRRVVDGVSTRRDCQALAAALAELLIDVLGYDGTSSLRHRTEGVEAGEPGRVVTSVSAADIVKLVLLSGPGRAFEVEPEPDGLPRRVVVSRDETPFEIYLDDEVADGRYAALLCYAFLVDQPPFPADFLSEANNLLAGACAYCLGDVLLVRSDLFLSAGVTMATVLRHLMAFPAQVAMMRELVEEFKRSEGRRPGRSVRGRKRGRRQR